MTFSAVSISARLTSRWVTARMRLPAAVPMPTPRSLQASTSLAVVQPGLAYVMRSDRAGVDLNGQNVVPTPGDDLQLRYQSRHDVIADEVRQAFFKVQRFRHTSHVARTVLDADEHRASRGIGE